jgi:hypothetical protein
MLDWIAELERSDLVSSIRTAATSVQEIQIKRFAACGLSTSGGLP